MLDPLDAYDPASFQQIHYIREMLLRCHRFNAKKFPGEAPMLCCHTYILPEFPGFLGISRYLALSRISERRNSRTRSFTLQVWHVNKFAKINDTITTTTVYKVEYTTVFQRCWWLTNGPLSVYSSTSSTKRNNGLTVNEASVQTCCAST